MRIFSAVLLLLVPLHLFNFPKVAAGPVVTNGLMKAASSTDSVENHLLVQIYPSGIVGKLSGTIDIQAKAVSTFDDMEFSQDGFLELPFKFGLKPVYVFAVTATVKVEGKEPVTFHARKVYMDRVLTLGMERKVASHESRIDVWLMQQVDLNAYKQKFSDLEMKMANIGSSLGHRIGHYKGEFERSLAAFIKKNGEEELGQISGAFTAVNEAVTDLGSSYHGISILNGYNGKIKEAVDRVQQQAQELVTENQQIHGKIGKLNEQQKQEIGEIEAKIVQKLVEANTSQAAHFEGANGQLENAKDQLKLLDEARTSGFGSLMKELGAVEKNGIKLDQILRTQMAKIGQLTGQMEGLNAKMGKMDGHMDELPVKVQHQFVDYIGSPKEAIQVRIDGEREEVSGKLNPILAKLLPALANSFIFKQIPARNDLPVSMEHRKGEQVL